MATHRGTRQARYPRFDTHQILGEQMTTTYPPEPFRIFPANANIT